MKNNRYVFGPGEYKTQAGETAVILGIRKDSTSNFNRIGYRKDKSGSVSWDCYGESPSGGSNSLVPPTEGRWVNLYRYRNSFEVTAAPKTFLTEEAAKAAASHETGGYLGAFRVEVPCA